MRFLDLLDSAEAKAGGAVGLFGREAARQRVPLGQLQMRSNVVRQFALDVAPAEYGQQAADGAMRAHGVASRMRATSEVAFAHFDTSTASCFLPALVSEKNRTLRLVSEVPHSERIQPSCWSRTRAG